MAIDTTVNALIDHFYKLCPNLTIQGSNDKIIISHVDDSRPHSPLGSGKGTCLILAFDGALLKVDMRSIYSTCHKSSRIIKGNDPRIIKYAYDLNRETDLQELEQLIIAISKMKMIK